MFTGIAGSTRAAADLETSAWGALLERHHAFGAR